MPAGLLATLACGLREDSRIKMKLSGVKVPQETILLTAIKDDLSFIAWAQTKDGAKGRNRPKSVLKSLLGDDSQNSDIQTFASGKDFEREWKELTEGR